MRFEYRDYLLGVLLMSTATIGVERWTLGIAQQGIKTDMQLSDMQLGFLSGLAFAVFYAVAGIPLARWADRGNRVTIISLSVAAWGVMMALCAAAASFLQLVTIRIAVAIGEAGCTPPAHSLIADYFSRAERPRAVSIFMLSSPVSVLIGYFIAGWLNEFYGWRATFLLLGLPGVALALVIWFTLREPRRAKSTMRSSQATPALACAQDTSSADPPALRTVCKVLWANSTFRHVVLSFAVIYFFGSGIGLWQPAFFIRSFGLQTGEIGTWFAVIWGIGGFVGTYWGGVAASRYAANNERLQLIAMAVMYCAFAVISSFIYLSSNRFVAFGLMGLAAVGIGTTYGTLFATIQALVPERMRAVAVAAVFFFANLVGHGMGPLAAGALSDALQPWVGQESLRYSLLVMCPGYAWAAWHLWRASATVAHDIQKHASA